MCLLLQCTPDQFLNADDARCYDDIVTCGWCKCVCLQEHALQSAVRHLQQQMEIKADCRAHAKGESVIHAAVQDAAAANASTTWEAKFAKKASIEKSCYWDIQARRRFQLLQEEEMQDALGRAKTKYQVLLQDKDTLQHGNAGGWHIEPCR